MTSESYYRNIVHSYKRELLESFVDAQRFSVILGEFRQLMQLAKIGGFSADFTEELLDELFSIFHK